MRLIFVYIDLEKLIVFFFEEIVLLDNFQCMQHHLFSHITHKSNLRIFELYA